MTAEEARVIMNEMDSISKEIRNKIDNIILKAAQNGKNCATAYIYKEHPKEKVVKALIKNGFKVTCEDNYDQRDGHCYTYEISW